MPKEKIEIAVDDLVLLDNHECRVIAVFGNKLRLVYTQGGIHTDSGRYIDNVNKSDVKKKPIQCQ